MKLNKVFLFLVLVLFLSGCESGVFEGVLDVNITNDRLDTNTYHQDQTTEIIDLKLGQIIANVTLNRNYFVGEEYINITSPIAPIIGNDLCLKDTDGQAFLQTKIQNVISLGNNSYQIELEMALDFPFSIDDGCSIENTNMAVDGSINKQIFSITPQGLNSNVSWHIIRMICSATGDAITGSDDTPDDTNFLLTDATTHGIYFRVSNNEKNKNIFYVKTNKDIKERMYDLDLNTIKNRNGFYSATFRRTYNGLDKNGVVIELTADTNSSKYHKYEVVIDRNLSMLETFDCVVQGHVTDWN